MTGAKILMLCHAKNHRYDLVEKHLSKAARTFDTMCISDKPDYRADVMKDRFKVPMQTRYDVVVDVFCTQDVLEEQNTYKNVAKMLKPGGLFLAKMGVFVFSKKVLISVEERKKFGLPLDYDVFIDAAYYLNTWGAITKYFDVEYAYIHPLRTKNDLVTGYLCNTPTDVRDSKDIPSDIIDACKKHGIDVASWNDLLNFKVIVLRKKPEKVVASLKQSTSLKQTVSVKKVASSKQTTKEPYVMLLSHGNKVRKVYRDKTHGDYVVLQKEKIKLSDIVSKYRYVEKMA